MEGSVTTSGARIAQDSSSAALTVGWQVGMATNKRSAGRRDQRGKACTSVQEVQVDGPKWPAQIGRYEARAYVESLKYTCRLTRYTGVTEYVVEAERTEKPVNSGMQWVSRARNVRRNVLLIDRRPVALQVQGTY